MTEAVLRSKILFFDSNPIGRIVTRFSKDISVIDLIISFYLVTFTFGILKLITTVIIIAIINPWILIPTFLIFGVMFFIMRIGAPVLLEA